MSDLPETFYWTREPPADAIREAVKWGRQSPCAKSKRGAVIFHRGTGEVVSSAYNKPPRPFFCDGSNACRASCGKVYVHAEAGALIWFTTLSKSFEKGQGATCFTSSRRQRVGPLWPPKLLAVQPFDPHASNERHVALPQERVATVPR